MKCSQCGMPLSPRRTSCPRCGASAGNGGAHPSGKIRLTRDSSSVPQHMMPPAHENNAHSQQSSWGTLAPAATPWEQPRSEQGAFTPQTGQFSPAQSPFPNQPYAATLPPQNAQQQMYNMPSTPMPAQPLPPPQSPYITGSPSLVQARRNPAPQPNTRLGYTIAGLCFMAGALIMVFVFIMAQSLSMTPQLTNTDANPTPAINQNAPQATAPAKNHSVQATPTTAAATATAAATPTAATNQLYIDQANLASAVDTRTGQPLQLSNTFHVGQTVYVTMAIHQAAYSGTICLNWAINQQGYPYNSTASPAGATDQEQISAYFFYKPGAAGMGTVDISWSSSADCSNKVPIKTLSFTVA